MILSASDENPENRRMTTKLVQMAIRFVGLIFGGKIFWGKFCERVLLLKQQRKKIVSASQRIEIEPEIPLESIFAESGH